MSHPDILQIQADTFEQNVIKVLQKIPIRRDEVAEEVIGIQPESALRALIECHPEQPENHLITEAQHPRNNKQAVTADAGWKASQIALHYHNLKEEQIDLWQVMNKEYAAAPENLLELMRHSSGRFGEGTGQRGLIDIFNLLNNESPLISRYRSMSMLLR